MMKPEKIESEKTEIIYDQTRDSEERVIYFLTRN